VSVARLLPDYEGAVARARASCAGGLAALERRDRSGAAERPLAPRDLLERLRLPGPHAGARARDLRCAGGWASTRVAEDWMGLCVLGREVGSGAGWRGTRWVHRKALEKYKARRRSGWTSSRWRLTIVEEIAPTSTTTASASQVPSTRSSVRPG